MSKYVQVRVICYVEVKVEETDSIEDILEKAGREVETNKALVVSCVGVEIIDRKTK